MSNSRNEFYLEENSDYDDNNDNNDINNINSVDYINNNIKQEVPWIEKYRPKKIDDIVLDKNTYTKILNIIQEKDMPNIIITGVPGIGKTTTIQCIARGIYGKAASEATLDLNASDDRGIKAVQEPIMTFCKKKINFKDMEKVPTHKIIILDEADNMTSKAQRQINNLMEKYHKTTRFAFTCNNSSDIIESIQSRCIIFRYYRLNQEQIIYRLKHICEQEKVLYEIEALNEIAIMSQGDMRHAINNLQLTYNGFNEIILDNVYQMCDNPQTKIIKQIFISCMNKDIKLALEILINLKQKGYSGSDILSSMTNTLKMPDFKEIPENIKIQFMKEIAKKSYIISKGIDTFMQLTACIANMILD